MTVYADGLYVMMVISFIWYGRASVEDLRGTTWQAGRPRRRPALPQSAPRCYSGSANANSALPWDDPSILGRKPSAQPPQPLGATMYCRPSTL